jgi:hypothetical protein
LETAYNLKIDASKPVPTFTITYPGNPTPTFVGVGRVEGSQVVITLGTAGREVLAPGLELNIGQYRWVLERTK